MSSPEQMVNVRYMVDDVQAAIDSYTARLGFALRSSAVPAFADVTRGNLLLLAGPASSPGRPMRDGRKPEPGGWNRIHLIVLSAYRVTCRWAYDVTRCRVSGQNSSFWP